MEKIIKYCPICGWETDVKDFNFCPHCSAVGGKNVGLVIKENREVRKNLSKDELIAQLKDIAEQEVNAPRTLHRNAMCYSIDPPRAVSVRCEECGKMVVIGSYLDNHSYINRIVESIRRLGYEANVKGLCLECAKKKQIEPMLLTRDSRHGQYDLGEYYHLFSFKPKDKDEFTYSITNDSLDYRILEAFLENKTDFEYEEEIIRIKEELPIIQMMTGITLPETEASKLEEQLQSIYTKRNNQNNEKLLEERKKEIETAMAEGRLGLEFQHILADDKNRIYDVGMSQKDVKPTTLTDNCFPSHNKEMDNSNYSCPYCGYDKIKSNFNFCPRCNHALILIKDEGIRDARENLSKDELIAQLKDIKEHEVNDPISRINAMCYSRISERELEKIERERQEEERYEMKRKERERKERERKERKRLKALKKKERTSSCDKEKGSSLFSKIKHFLSRK